MKNRFLLALCILSFFDGFAQAVSDSLRIRLKNSFPTSIYVSPILDGASAALEYSFNKKYALNLYAFKRQADESIYYGTKVNETLAEVFLKIYFENNQNSRFNLFFGPAFGARKIKYDESFSRFFIDDFFRSSLQENLVAKTLYFNPSYIGFDFTGRKGLIFEYAAGVCYQWSSGDTFIRGPFYYPYTDGINLRSRVLFGYKF